MFLRDPKTLSKKAVEVLRWLASEEGDGEIVCDGLECWYGTNRTSRRLVNCLVECVFVSFSDLGGSEHYSINESGRRFLEGLPPYRDNEGSYHDTMFTMPGVRG